MSTYVIGDVHGCFDELRSLLDQLAFDPSQDQLIFIGDLVNRGPDSVKTLEYVISLKDSAKAILGNHDLSLLAASVGAIKPKPTETYLQVLQHDNKDHLLAWLRQLPLMLRVGNTVVTHAGLYPLWSPEQALELSQEVQAALTGEQFIEFMHHMFGSEPDMWQDSLTGWDRLRFITNAMTRMRYCKPNGALNLAAKGAPSKQKQANIPWFDFPNPRRLDTEIIFGHWASLEGKCESPNIVALDTGCVYGGTLTGYCIESKQRFCIDCNKQT